MEKTRYCLEDTRFYGCAYAKTAESVMAGQIKFLASVTVLIFAVNYLLHTFNY